MTEPTEKQLEWLKDYNDSLNYWIDNPLVDKEGNYTDYWEEMYAELKYHADIARDSVKCKHQETSRDDRNRFVCNICHQRTILGFPA